MGQVVYFGLCLLGCLIFGSSGTTAEGAKNGTDGRARCPSGVLYYKQYCYEFVNNYVSWYTAEAMCQELRPGSEGHLAVILSANEGKIVVSYLKRKHASNVWICLQGTAYNGFMVWEWCDGSSVSWPLWDGCRISSSYSSKDCVSLTNIQNSVIKKTLQRSCSDTLPYLCKYRADY